jgi:hypothetical protein
MRARFTPFRAVVALAVVTCTLAGSARALTSAAPEATVTGFSPKQAMIGQLVTVTGTNLDGTQGVSFGSVAATSVAVDPTGTWVRAVVPPGVSPGSVYINLNIGGAQQSVGPVTIEPGSVTPQPNPQPATTQTSPSPPVHVVVAPRISAITPLKGTFGTRVTIHGANLGHSTWLRFGGTKAHFTIASDSELIATVPRHAHSGKLSIHSSGGTAVSGARFTVLKSAAT